MATITSILLKWYGENARILPWRVTPKQARNGKKPDPYKVWISEIMLQQTTVNTVIPYFEKFLEKWPHINALSEARESDILEFWAGLGYYARGRNLLKCAKELKLRFLSVLPNNKEDLLSLPGIGEYTASAIRSIAFGEMEVVIDGNVERVISRIFKIETPIKSSKKIIKQKATRLFPKYRSGDFAQAIMDLANIVCKPKKPNCAECPLNISCLSFASGVVDKIPLKIKKTKKPLRKGFVFFMKMNNNEFLLETRPSEGLLGGLLGFPTTDWITNKVNPIFPLDADWHYTNKIVSHNFSHFKLELEIILGEKIRADISHYPYKVVSLNNFDPESMPTLMRKVYYEVIKT